MMFVAQTHVCFGVKIGVFNSPKSSAGAEIENTADFSVVIARGGKAEPVVESEVANRVLHV